MLKLQVKCMDNFIIPKTKTTQNTNNRIFLKGINRSPTYFKNWNYRFKPVLLEYFQYCNFVQIINMEAWPFETYYIYIYIDIVVQVLLVCKKHRAVRTSTQ